MNKSKLFSIIGTAILAAFVLIVVFAIGMQYKSIYGIKQDALTLGSHTLSDGLKAKAHEAQTLAALWSLGFVASVIALILSIVRIWTGGIIDLVFKIVILVLAVAGMVFTVWGTGYIYNKSVETLFGVTYNPFNMGMIAVNYLLTLAGGITAIVLTSLALAPKYNG